MMIMKGDNARPTYISALKMKGDNFYLFTAITLGMLDTPGWLFILSGDLYNVAVFPVTLDWDPDDIAYCWPG